MNTYLVWCYQGHGKNRYEWSGCRFWSWISDKATWPVWQVRALSLREAVKQTRDEWNRRRVNATS